MAWQSPSCVSSDDQTKNKNTCLILALGLLVLWLFIFCLIGASEIADILLEPQCSCRENLQRYVQSGLGQSKIRKTRIFRRFLPSLSAI